MKTEIILRFFSNEEKEEVLLGKISTNSNSIPIPHKGDLVDINEIFCYEEDEYIYDYDYYKVKSVYYTYSESLILVDIFVKGKYFEEIDNE